MQINLLFNCAHFLVELLLPYHLDLITPTIRKVNYEDRYGMNSVHFTSIQNIYIEIVETNDSYKPYDKIFQ